MMIKSLVLILALGQAGCASGSSLNVAGDWMYQGTKGSDLAVECPDLLSIKAGGSYRVINDCYGENPRDPVVEHGHWELSQQTNEIIFFDREFITNYRFSASSEDVIALILMATESELVLLINNYEEKYRRIKGVENKRDRTKGPE